MSTPVFAADAPTYREVRQVMGTVAEIQVWAADLTTAQAAVDSAFLVYSRIDSLMSTWNKNSTLSRFNAAPSGRWHPVGPEIVLVLETARQLTDLTTGAFEATIFPLVELWGFRNGKPRIPSADELTQTVSRIGAEHLQSSHNCARFLQSGMALDFGGIAKGYALDRAALAMKQAGATEGVLDLGGNLFVFGHSGRAEVAIIDPQSAENWALTLPISAQAVATSAQYERWLEIEGEAYGHVLDPRTGWPVPAGRSATVLAPEGIWADGLATALLVLGADKGLPLIEKMDGVEAVFIDESGVRMTRGLDASAIVKEDKPK